MSEAPAAPTTLDPRVVRYLEHVRVEKRLAARTLTLYTLDLEKLAQNLYISAQSMAQYAALAWFKPETLAILPSRRSEFGRRRHFLLPAFRELGYNNSVEP